MQLRRDRPPRAERKTPPPASGATWSLPRGLIVMLSVAGAVVAVMGMKAFAGVLGPTFLALMLTMAVQPVQTWVHRRGWRPWIGMVAALFLVVLILLGLLGALVLSVAQLASELPKYSGKLDDMLNGVRDALADLGVDTEQIHNALNGLDVGKVVDLLSVALSNALGIFSNLFFVLALLLFMAIDGMMIDRKLAVVAKTRPEIAYALGVFAIGTRKYLVVSTVFGLIVAIFDGGALWLMGVPLPVLWALLSFITNYIPNIGFVIGLIPPALLALLLDIDPTTRWVNVLIQDRAPDLDENRSGGDLSPRSRAVAPSPGVSARANRCVPARHAWPWCRRACRTVWSFRPRNDHCGSIPEMRPRPVRTIHHR